MRNDHDAGDNLPKQFRELMAKLLHDAYRRQVDEWELTSGEWIPSEVVIAEVEKMFGGKGWDTEDEP